MLCSLGLAGGSQQEAQSDSNGAWKQPGRTSCIRSARQSRRACRLQPAELVRLAEQRSARSDWHQAA